MPTFHLVSQLLTLSNRYALKGHEDYSQHLKDPTAVQSYHEILLRPTCYLVSELLNISCRYALKGREVKQLDFQGPRTVQFHLQDPVKAHLPSGVRAIEDIKPVCPERTREIGGKRAGCA